MSTPTNAEERPLSHIQILQICTKFEECRIRLGHKATAKEKPRFGTGAGSGTTNRRKHH